MKLFRRIMIQVIVGVLLVSQVTLLYTLWESRRQSLEDTEKYEQQVFQNHMDAFLNALNNAEYMGEREEVLALTNAFRSVFGSKAALYFPEKGKEIYNKTPYEFEYEQISHILRDGQAYEMEIDGSHLLVLNSWERMGRNAYGVVYCVDVSEIYHHTERLYIKGLVMTMLLLLVAGSLLYWGIRQSVQPLMELKKAASDIAGGNYGGLVKIEGKDEIAQLGESFNYMSEEIKRRVEELEEINHAQRRLIGSLAHELKTPMTAIIGYAESLLTLRLSEERRAKALTYIQKEGSRLSRLSIKMLELTGLYEEGGHSLERKASAVAELLEMVKNLTRFKLKEKNIVMEVSCEPENLVWDMDTDMMTSLLLNLVDNAYKALGEGGKILVHADETGIFVEDNGKGIPKDELEKVTEAFYMVDKSRAKSAGSVGLGLAFCKEIAQLHGARLVIQSEEGIGTRVIVAWKNA